MLRLCLALLLAALMGACTAAPPPTATAPAETVVQDAALPPPAVAAKNFVTVVERVEPVAEALCRARAPRLNCDLQIIVDARRDQPPNAFQTVLKNGQPAIAFTISLIAHVRNQDELAFVLGHEAAHHIAGHIARTRISAAQGAAVAGAIAEASGAAPSEIRRAENLGAEVGARTYSKAFELEADALGTEIALRAGYDPVRGAAYFTRLRDPGNVFLGTHPPNAARIETVRRTAALLQRGGF